MSKHKLTISNHGGGLKNKAFTLIELLAIIIILAIISVITIPIILSVIDNAKQGAIIDSFYGYKEAINNFYIEKLSEDTNFTLDGGYMVIDGKLGDYEIPFNGDIPTNGRLVYKDNEIIGGTLEIGEYVVTIIGNKVTAKRGTSPLKVVTKGDGLYASTIEMDKGRYLYRGKDPNNYLILPENGTDTLYRIISYETDGTIKVIRDDRIGNKNIEWDSNSTVTKAPWSNTNFDESNQIPTRFNDNNTYCKHVPDYSDYYGCSVWGTQNNTYYEGKTLNELYNSFHYKWYPSADTTTLNPTNPNLTTTVTQEASINILLNREWLPEVGLEKYIDNHEFYVGGVYPNSKNLSTEKKEEANYKWRGLIGLMYITDMVESSTNPACKSVYENFWNANSALQSSGAWPCKNNIEGTDYGNWLHKTTYNEWFISAYSLTHGHVWNVFQAGNFDYYRADYGSISARPVFFLKSSTVLQGDGTKNNPYRIAS